MSFIDAIDCVQIVTKGVKKTSIVSTVIVNNDVVNELDNANKQSHKVYLYCKKMFVKNDTKLVLFTNALNADSLLKSSGSVICCLAIVTLLGLFLLKICVARGRVLCLGVSVQSVRSKEEKEVLDHFAGVVSALFCLPSTKLWKNISSFLCSRY